MCCNHVGTKKECEHELVKFCPNCKKVYCVGCGKEWEKYKQPYTSYTYYPTYPYYTYPTLKTSAVTSG